MSPAAPAAVPAAGASHGRGARRLLLTGLVAGSVAAVAWLAAVTALARVLVTPRRARPDDVRILGVDDDSVILTADPETTSPGRYGLWLDGGSGHARVGEVLDHDVLSGTVTRALLGVDRGRLVAGPARWNQYYYAGSPLAALGLPYQDVFVPGPLGVLPAWFVPPEEPDPASRVDGERVVADTWVVLVHGRGATREECLRALPLVHRLGHPALVISYRNDSGAPRSSAGTYELGDAEWEDVEVAVQYALDHGARDVVLFGWSMGGAVVLQTLARSWVSTSVRAIVLDAPVIDWRDVVDHHARVMRVPPRLSRHSQQILEQPVGWRLAGVTRPLSFDRLDWIRRAAELRVPVLLLHSEDDEFVPIGPSRRLAAARPDLVTFVPSTGARHTKEWNVDPEAWDAAVARFLLGL